MKKYEFMYRMDKALGALSESEKGDIINDYEEHFRIGAENGKTDDEICEHLGNPEELAKSYLEGTEQNQNESEQKSEPANSGVSDGGQLPPQNEAYKATTASQSNTVGIIALILLSIFVFIPAGGTILSILFGLLCAAIGVAVGGVAVICAAFFTGVSAVGIAAMVTLGIALIALSVLLGFGTYYACYGVYKLVIMLVDFCKTLIK